MSRRVLCPSGPTPLRRLSVHGPFFLRYTRDLWDTPDTPRVPAWTGLAEPEVPNQPPSIKTQKKIGRGLMPT